MGLRTSPQEEQLWICDGCESTIVATLNTLLAKEKWRKHFGKDWQLILCDECQPEDKK